jgi:ornithine cyclodeaminase/alanine dehydrogenase
MQPLRYLASSAIDECLPNVQARLDLAASALVALSRGTAEMPPKIGIHPRDGALIHAMPAWLRDRDIAGMKWIAAFPGNAQRELPAINGLIVLNDAGTGLPTWIMEAGRITAIRTAAVSGVGLRLFRPASVKRVAILGAGVQARSHSEVVASLVPEAEVVIYDPHADRAEAVAESIRTGGGRPSVATSARDASSAAEVVITVAKLGKSQLMRPDWLRPGAIVIAVDFATYASAELARAARVFATDDRAQFLAYRDAGYFDGYPDPQATLGELCDGLAEPGPPDERPVLVNHLGVGLADVVFASAIAECADELGLGVALER